MLTRWSDFDRAFSMMDELRRRMDRVFDEYEGRPSRGAEPEPYARAGVWPRVNLFDAGTSLLMTADVPGLAEGDVKLTVQKDVVALSGERRADAPEGYSAHRQERPAFKFSRSFTLPCTVDAEKTTATIKDGVLTVSFAKAPEAQPRQIAVRAQ